MINEFQKFPTDKEAYDKSYERIFGKGKQNVGDDRSDDKKVSQKKTVKDTILGSVETTEEA